MEKDKKKLVGLRRGFEVLRVMADRGGEGSFNELKAACNELPSPTLSRLLKVLVEEGLLEKPANGGPYRLGGATITLAQSVVGAIPKEKKLQPVLDALAARTGHSAAYLEMSGNHGIFVAKSLMPDAFSYRTVGDPITRINRNAFTQICLAYMDEKKAVRLLDGLTEPSAIPRKQFLQRLKRIRREGTFLAFQEDSRLLARVVGAVMADSGAFLGAIGVTFHTAKVGKKEEAGLRVQVTNAAHEAARALAV